MRLDSADASVPDLLLERYRLDEVTSAERADVERRLRQDERLRQRLEQIERSDEAIREAGFAATLTSRLQARAASAAGAATGRGSRTDRAARPFRRWAVPAAIGAAALLLVLAGSRSVGLRQPDPSGERIKGLRPALAMFRQTPGGSEALSDGVSAREGDLVRIGYQSAGQSYGVIVSIDGRGSVTVHLPATGLEAARLQAGGEVLLDNAYELDDAPRWECFYFVTAREPFDARAVIEAARREGALHRASPRATLSLSRGLEQSTFVLQKEHRP